VECYEVPVPVWLKTVSVPLFRIYFLHLRRFTDIIWTITPMDHEEHKDETLIKTTVRIPQSIITDLKKAGKLHRRNFNSELIVALEDYLNNWRNQH